MTPVVALVLALLAVPAAAPAPARLEVVLANGKVVRGSAATWVGSELVVTTEGGPVRVPAADVVELREGKALPAAPARKSTVAGSRSPTDGPRTPAAPPAPNPDDAAVQEALRRGATSDVRANERVLRDALVQHPGHPLLHVALGRTLVAEGRFAEALGPLRAAGDGLDDSARRARDLALAEALSRLDRPEEALAALQATPDDASGSVAAVLAKLVGDVGVRAERVVHESTHFTFHAPFDAGQLALEPLIRGVESAYDQLAEVFEAGPSEKVIVILYPGREFWESLELGSTIGGLYDGKVRVPAGRIDPLTESLTDVLRHEVAHAFVDSLSAGRANRAWHEGIAEHFEGDDVRSLESALGARYHRDPEAWPPDFDHPTAHSRVNFFVKRHGAKKLREFLVAIGRGATEDQALEEAIGMDEAALDAEWGRALAGKPR